LVVLEQFFNDFAINEFAYRHCHLKLFDRVSIAAQIKPKYFFRSNKINRIRLIQLYKDWRTYQRRLGLSIN